MLISQFRSETGIDEANKSTKSKLWGTQSAEVNEIEHLSYAKFVIGIGQ